MPSHPPQVVRSRASIGALSDQYKKQKLRIGFVPTMGALHNGHLELVRQARACSDVVIVSIFVNPMQFAPGEDFAAYPRDEASDLEKLRLVGCDAVYLPVADEMYPAGSVTDVRVPGLSDLLDGIYRPHFFYGVTTVVARLFLHVRPDVAVFGEKDFQQLQIVRRMVMDLGFPVEIVGAPTVRDPDGLAQSSRNAYLSAEERRCASALHAALHRGAIRARQGAAPADVTAEAKRFLLAAGFTKIDYVDLVDAVSLVAPPADRAAWPGALRMLGAGWVGATRLIDNLALAI
ncbi:MAG: pantoate--beta-alanine ligase [Pseudomonadota bacterium]